MKRIFLPVILTVSFLLCSCGSSSSLSDNLSVKIDEDVISLYMDRSDAESILGVSSENTPAGMCEYGSVSVGYTDDKVSAIVLDDDSYSTVSGLQVGSSDYDGLGLSFSKIGKTSLSESYFSYDGSEFSQVDSSISDASFCDGAYLDVIADESGKIKTIGIYDMYSAKTADFDN